jgi:hypothetical protein
MALVKDASGNVLLNANEGSTDSASGGADVTPSNSTELTGVRGLWIGTGGNVALTLDDVNVILKNVADGTLLPVAPTKVRSTGTTATDIVALK